jgi:hypothetical protein
MRPRSNSRRARVAAAFEQPSHSSSRRTRAVPAVRRMTSFMSGLKKNRQTGLPRRRASRGKSRPRALLVSKAGSDWRGSPCSSYRSTRDEGPQCRDNFQMLKLRADRQQTTETAKMRSIADVIACRRVPACVIAGRRWSTRAVARQGGVWPRWQRHSGRMRQMGVLAGCANTMTGPAPIRCARHTINGRLSPWVYPPNKLWSRS